MQWSVLELQKYFNDSIAFAEILNVKKDLMARNKNILDASLAKVKGNLYINKSEYLLYYQTETTLMLPSTRSLIPVSLPIKFSVDEIFMTQEQFDKRKEIVKEEAILIIEGQAISLKDSVRDNILLNIPMQVFSKEEKNNASYPKGKNWQVMSESHYEKLQKEKGDSLLAKLKDFL
ncbi:MAG: DUF177 domain-containing protein [Lactobacillales bacterium]|jgi:uncharacterized protein|nr:DUF177 domain-containing protein [Lactobacillales bacterium]